LDYWTVWGNGEDVGHFREPDDTGCRGTCHSELEEVNEGINGSSTATSGH
jgi:hypothetical protein